MVRHDPPGSWPNEHDFPKRQVSGMQQRQPGTIVYVAGDMTPMVVVEPDQWVSAKQQRLVRLRPESHPDEPPHWFRSDMVTGG